MNKRFIPFAYASNIYDISIEFYKKLGVKYLIVDLDNTLDSYKIKEPLARTIELKNNLQANGISMIIASNNRKKRVEKYAKKLGVEYFSSLLKPFTRRLRKKLKENNINKDEILIIGDQILTDIGLANGMHAKSVLCDKLVKEDQITTRFNRIFFDNYYRKKLRKKGLLIDWKEYL